MASFEELEKRIIALEEKQIKEYDELFEVIKLFIKSTEIESIVRSAYNKHLTFEFLDVVRNLHGDKHAENIHKKIFEAAVLEAGETLKKKGIQTGDDITGQINDLLDGLNILTE